MRYCVLIFVIFSLLGADWPPATVLTADFPRILFTDSDSAEIASTLFEWPRSSHYSSLWSRANGSGTNGSETADLGRAAIAQSAAFVLYFGVTSSGDTLTTAQRTALEVKVVDYMENIRFPSDITIYSNGSFHYPCQRLIQYSVAADLLRARGISFSNTAFRNLADEIYDKATYWLFTYVVDDLTLFANHKLIVAGALGTAALAYPEHGEDWINYAMTKTEKVMFTEETSPTEITGFAEGPHYFKYAFEHLTMMFTGLRYYLGEQTLSYTDPCGGEDNASIPCPYFDIRYDRLYHWISNIRLPDGTIPTLDDGFRHEGFCFTAGFADRDGSYFWNTPGGGSRIFVSPTMCAYGADTADALPSGLTSFPEAGNLVFRSGDERGIYFHFLAEHGIANTNIHDQSDACSFIFHAFGNDLAMDPGYIHYDERGRVNGITAHNTILVNGGGPSAASPADSWIENTYEIPDIYYGEVRTNYSSSDIRRRAFLLDDLFVIITDECESSSSREFTFQCHGAGLESEGTFTPLASGGLWTEESPFYLLTSATEIDYETSVHELGYNSWADHTVVRARKTGTQVRFASVLIAGLDSEPNPRMTALSGISGRFGFLQRQGFYIGNDGSAELSWSGDELFGAISGHGNFATILKDSISGALLNVVLVGVDSLRVYPDFFVKGGTPLYCGIDIESSLLTGFNRGDANTITFEMAEPSIVTGVISYTWSSGRLILEVAAASLFTIDMTPLEVCEELAPTIFDKAKPNPFNSAVEISFPQNADGLKIYNIQGRLVTTVARQGKSVVWNPENCSSGLYLYKFIADGQLVNGGVLVYLP